jgi:hypothetical protein
MDVGAKKQLQAPVRPVRQPPRPPLEITARFDSDGVLGPDLSTSISTLIIEATGPTGEPAAWLDDGWWTDVMQVWGEEAMTIHLAPTPGALLHPVLLHQVDMVHRVVPWWRVLGFAYQDDVRTDEHIAALVRSTYDEVRFFDTLRPASAPQGDSPLEGAARSHSTRVRPLAELFGAIRFEQARLGCTRLILVRLPASAAPGGARPIH